MQVGIEPDVLGGAKLPKPDDEVVLFNTWQNESPLQILMEEGQTLPGIFEGLQGATVGTTLPRAGPCSVRTTTAAPSGTGTSRCNLRRMH